MKSVYISGPITSLGPYKQKANIELADEKARELAQEGWAVFCPHTMTNGWGDKTFLEWADFLSMDIYWLDKCDAIYMLPGWECSEGARMELIVARGLGKEILGA